MSGTLSHEVGQPLTNQIGALYVPYIMIYESAAVGCGSSYHSVWHDSTFSGSCKLARSSNQIVRGFHSNEGRGAKEFKAAASMPPGGVDTSKARVQEVLYGNRDVTSDIPQAVFLFVRGASLTQRVVDPLARSFDKLCAILFSLVHDSTILSRY
jgi:hypothetical protein